MTVKTPLFARILSVAALLALAASPVAQASDNYFLKFAGVKSESVDKDHKDWIAFDSFSWGVHAIPGSSHGAHSIEFDDFSWTQRIDLSTPRLFDMLANRNNIREAVAELVTPIGGISRTYFRMTFNDVLLSSMSLTGGAPTVPSLLGAFSYGSIQFDYWSFDHHGGVVRHETAKYDLDRGKGSLGALSLLYARGSAGPEITAAVPEPETWALLLAGLGLLGFAARRQI